LKREIAVPEDQLSARSYAHNLDLFARKATVIIADILDSSALGCISVFDIIAKPHIFRYISPRPSARKQLSRLRNEEK